MLRCPGSQNFSQPRPELMKCPSCYYEVEIWSDEVKATCPRCGKTFMKESEQSCIDWCKFSKDCLGDKLYDKYMRNKAITLKENSIRVTLYAIFAQNKEAALQRFHLQ